MVVKVPDSAGSAGNLPLESRALAGLSLGQLRAHLLRLLAMLGWTGSYPLMIEVWDSDVVSTPSVQIWIPLLKSGRPVIEGVFEQTVQGAEGNFIGAVRARLAEKWRDGLVSQAARLACLLQHLGYFGRCSFDAVIVDGLKPDIHWIECNGRWGGVSVPMTLLNRLAPNAHALEVVIVQREAQGLQAMAFEEVLDRLEGDLYQPGKSDEGVITLTPTGYERGDGMHFLTIATTFERAQQLAQQTGERLEFRRRAPFDQSQ